MSSTERGGFPFRLAPLSRLSQQDFRVLLDQMMFMWSATMGAGDGSQIGKWKVHSRHVTSDQRVEWVGKRGFAMSSVRCEMRTDAPLENLANAVDPLRWTSATPFLMRVEPLTPRVTTASGWSQQVRETVGTPLFEPAVTVELQCERTDTEGAHTLVYDLARPNELAEIDRGLFGVRDEGALRLIEITKDLRLRPDVRDFEMLLARHWVTLIGTMLSWGPAAELLNG